MKSKKWMFLDVFALLVKNVVYITYSKDDGRVEGGGIVHLLKGGRSISHQV